MGLLDKLKGFNGVSPAYQGEGELVTDQAIRDTARFNGVSPAYQGEGRLGVPQSTVHRAALQWGLPGVPGRRTRRTLTMMTHNEELQWGLPGVPGRRSWPIIPMCAPSSSFNGLSPAYQGEGRRPRSHGRLRHHASMGSPRRTREKDNGWTATVTELSVLQWGLPGVPGRRDRYKWSRRVTNASMGSPRRTREKAVTQEASIHAMLVLQWGLPGVPGRRTSTARRRLGPSRGFNGVSPAYQGEGRPQRPRTPLCWRRFNGVSPAYQGEGWPGGSLTGSATWLQWGLPGVPGRRRGLGRVGGGDPQACFNGVSPAYQGEGGFDS